MKYLKPQVFAVLALVLYSLSLPAQLITMSNKCYNLVAQGNTQLKAYRYEDALKTFNEVLNKCKAKDAKELGNTGKALALNGLQQYAAASEAADAAIKASKGTNVTAYFAKATALSGLQRKDDAKAAYDKMIALTEKNKNVAERATIYAKIAELEWNQQHIPEAYDYLSKAMTLNSSNPSFFLLRGNIKASEHKYKEAFEDYDQVIVLGKADEEIYQTRATKRVDMAEEKYNIKTINDLAKKMNTNEKADLCADLRKAFELGWKQMTMDMLSTLICK